MKSPDPNPSADPTGALTPVRPTRPRFERMKLLALPVALFVFPALAEAFDPSGELRRVDVPALGVSFEIPADWIEDIREGTRTWHAPGQDPEAIFSIQLIDNVSGESSLEDQVAKLRAEVSGLPGNEVLAEDENAFAGLASHMIMGRFQPGPNREQGMVWVVVSRAQHFYWIALTFPPGKWQNGFATLMERIVNGFRFTALYQDSIEESNRLASEFLQDVRAGRLDRAYGRTNEVFRSNTSRDDFGSFVESNPGLTEFRWFRTWENAGNREQRLIFFELGGFGTEMFPVLLVQLNLTEGREFLVETIFFDHGMMPLTEPGGGAPPGFVKVVMDEAGFACAIPEGWAMFAQPMPGDGMRFVFRPRGGGMVRNRRAIAVILGEGNEDLSKLLEGYLGMHSELPGFQRAGEFALQLGGQPAVGAVFRLEGEDDRGVFATANTVSVLRSASLMAILHITMEAEGSGEKFEAAFQPVLDHFRLLE